MARIEINTESCKSCSYCVISCPKKVIEIGEKVNSKGYLYAVAARPEDCIGCAMCGQICPDAAIEVWR
ncbi:MAG: ferredoxin family protein [Mogibacterium sp.]|nr:ferredoxin family protein [Candidatus Crickella caballi]MCQ2566791.1 ferredoxin family protein [Mogibacterium sp.]